MSSNSLGNFCRKVTAFYTKMAVALRTYFIHTLIGQVGAHLRVYGRVTIYYPEKIRLGERCTLNEGVLIDARGGVTIGNNVRISSYAVIETGYLEKHGCPRKHGAKEIIIKDNVWIATGARILAGVTIGENAIIAAGAIVTKDVPANTVAMGIPAKCIPIQTEKA